VCEDSAGAQKSESLKDSKVKLRRSSVFENIGETQCYRVHRGKKVKVEAFYIWNSSKCWKKSAKAQEEHNCRRIQPKRSRPLKISRLVSSERVHRAEEILNRWISLRIVDSHQIYQEELEV
jgi:hypothetical protein